jgi:hypothetical protein
MKLKAMAKMAKSCSRIMWYDSKCGAICGREIDEGYANKLLAF